MANNEAQMRELFEKSVCALGLDMTRTNYSGPRYSNDRTEWTFQGFKAAIASLPRMTEEEIVELLASMLFHRDARRDGGLTTWQDKTTTGMHTITAFNPELARKYRDDAKDMMPEIIAKLPHIVEAP